jgi:hypothetical protein
VRRLARRRQYAVGLASPELRASLVSPVHPCAAGPVSPELLASLVRLFAALPASLAWRAEHLESVRRARASRPGALRLASFRRWRVAR